MAKGYQRVKEKLQIEGQTIQWLQDTDEINRKLQIEGQKI
jgi:Zn/Cd-binding protein ZinT